MKPTLPIDISKFSKFNMPDDTINIDFDYITENNSHYVVNIHHVWGHTIIKTHRYDFGMLKNKRIYEYNHSRKDFIRWLVCYLDLVNGTIHTVK